MNKKDKEINSKSKEGKVELEKPKKEFKIEIVKIGKLEEKTAGPVPPPYDCIAPSDLNAKENFDLVDRRDILARLASISVETWNYKFQSPTIRHIGPMAQDFAATFGVGEDDKHINIVDAFGVALASIQALYEMIQEKDAKITALEQRLRNCR
ncbi:MAG TPA: tail fiber domain-containing protein [Thermodesulfobacteriota bacterium]|nr:tail fiber domain-containing protein [Thermodesulfobacteriota bacterium]